MNPDVDYLPPDVIAALEEGRKVEAIKALRQARGLGLREAKDMVDAYEHGSQFWSEDAQTVPEDTGMPIEVIDAIRTRGKIEAIKLLRARRGLGLREAKEQVDAYCDQNPGQQVHVQKVSESGVGSLVWIVVITAVAYAAYRFLTSAQ